MKGAYSLGTSTTASLYTIYSQGRFWGPADSAGEPLFWRLPKRSAAARSCPFLQNPCSRSLTPTGCASRRHRHCRCRHCSLISPLATERPLDGSLPRSRPPRILRSLEMTQSLVDVITKPEGEGKGKGLRIGGGEDPGPEVELWAVRHVIGSNISISNVHIAPLQG